MMNINKALSAAATASEDLFCLKWSNFQNSISSEFKKIQDDEDLVDITFACEGGMFGAHKLVMFACSPYLKALLKNNPCSHPIFFMNGVKQGILKSILDFMYLGEVRINQEEFTDFIRVAELFKIRGVTRDVNTVDATKNLSDILSHEQHIEHGPKHKKARHHTTNNDTTKKTSEFLFFTDQMQTGPAGVVKSADEIQPKREASEFQEEICHQQSEYTTSANRAAFNDSTTRFAESRPDSRIPEYDVPGTGGSNVCDDSWLSSSGEKDPNEQKFKKSSNKAQCLVPSSCPVCGRVYSNISNLRQHLRLIHNPTAVDCPICHKSFNSDLYLKRHYVSMHNIPPPADANKSQQQQQQQQQQPVVVASTPVPGSVSVTSSVAASGAAAVAVAGLSFTTGDVYTTNKRMQQQQQQHHHQQQQQHHETTVSPNPAADNDIKNPMQQQQQQTWNPYESSMNHAL